MKRKIFSVLFALVLVLSFSLVTAVPAMALLPNTVWVDDDYNPSTPTWGTTHFDKIQDGIDGVATGGTVHVAAGTYNENVDVNKMVTLIGAGPSSTIVQGAHTDHVFHVQGTSNVFMDGFTVQGATDPDMAGIRIACCTGGTFRNNVVTGNRFGINISNASTVILDVNEVCNNSDEGIYLESNCTYCDIYDNIVHDNDVIHHGILLEYCSGTRVQGNEVYNEAFGIGLLASDNNTILHNNIHDNGHGIYIDSGSVETSDNNTILGNNIVNNNGTEDSGIHLTSGASGTVIHFNNIVGNSSTPGSYGVFNEYNVPVDAENNWWGDASGPGGSGPGTGDAVSNYVDYTPWLGAPLELPAVHYETLGPGYHVVDASEEADTVVTLTVTAEASETDIYIGEYESQPFPREPFPDASLGKFIDICLSNPAAVRWPIYVEVYYTDGEVRDAGIAEHSLGLYYYESVDTFHRCSDTGVDTTNNIIWANVTAEEAGYLVWTPFGGGGSPRAVGGTVYPVNKVSILMPWIGLAVALALAGVFVTRWARRRVRG